jgi:YVTN family beta-propeller protein
MSDDGRTMDALRYWMAESEYPRSTEPVVDGVLGAIASVRQEAASPVGNALPRYAKVGLVAAAAVVAVAIGASLLRPEPAAGPGVGPSPSPTPRPTISIAPDPFAGVPETRVDADVMRVPGTDTGYLSVTTDAVWAAASSGLLRIDPTTLEFEQVERAPRFGMAASPDAIWVTDFDAGIVSRIDPATSERTDVAELSGNPAALALSGESVWVAQQRGGSVTRLEATSGNVVAEVAMAGASADGFMKGIAADEQSVWVGISGSGVVVRIDPSTNEVVAEIETTTSPCGGIALQPDAVWVSSCFDDHYAIHIDPRTDELVAEIDIRGHNGGAVLVDGYPWFPVGNRLVRIDPATDRIDQIVAFAPDEFTSFGATLGFDAIWVGSSDGRIARIPIEALPGP